MLDTFEPPVLYANEIPEDQVLYLGDTYPYYEGHKYELPKNTKIQVEGLTTTMREILLAALPIYRWYS